MSGTLAVLANDALLLLTAGIWGFAFVAQRVGMEHVGPFTYTAIRFALGALALLPLVTARRRAGRRAAEALVAAEAGLDAAPRDAPRAGLESAPAAAALPRIHPLRAGLLAGAVLTGGSLLQQVGLVTTTAGKGGFITGLYVVLVPLAGLFWKHRAGWPRWVGAALAAGGLYLLSVTGAFTIQRGDLLVLIGALFWTAHVLVVGWLSPRTDPVALACVQFAVCAALSGLILPFVERPRAGRHPRRGCPDPVRRPAVGRRGPHPAGGGPAARAARARGAPAFPGVRVRGAGRLVAARREVGGPRPGRLRPDVRRHALRPAPSAASPARALEEALKTAQRFNWAGMKAQAGKLK